MDYYLGQITLFPYSFTPRGWALCDGRAMNIVQNTALYSLLGVQFGGDGVTSFNLPNLIGTEPAPNVKYYICTEGIYPMRD